MKILINNALIFFDGNCNLCNYSVNFILKRESASYFKFSSLNSNFSKEFFKDKNFDFQQLNAIILYENGQFYTKSEAVLRIIKKLKFPYRLLYYFKYIPTTFRDFLYDIIAQKRYQWFGKKKVCYIPTVENLSRFL